MKKQLLTVLTSFAAVVAVAQTPSPSWTINQQANFPTAPATATARGIRYMDAVDANVVWAIGYDGNAFNRNYNWWSKTTNGGNTWTGGDVFSDTNTWHIGNIEGIDANTAWVSAFKKNVSPQGLGGVFRTTNGGVSWQNMSAAGMFTNTQSFCNIVSFFTPSVGIAMGDPNNGGYEIWRTLDGGLSWTLQPQTNIPAPNSSNEAAIINLYYKLGNSHLWFGTNEGRIYRTTDAGVTWNAFMVAPTTTLLEIAFTSPNVGLVYATPGNNVINVYRTLNGGANWTQVAPGGNIGYNDVVAVPGTGVFASFGPGTNNQFMSYSTDNGSNWIDWGSTGIQYLTADFVNATTGWAGGFDIPAGGITNIWKYNGAALAATVAPTAAFVIPPTLCGPSATVTANNTSSLATTYSWSSSPSAAFSSATATSPVITFASNASYTITLVASNANGTTTSQQVINVQNCTAPTASFSIPTICQNIPFPVINLSSGGSPAPSYSWAAYPANSISILPNNVVDNPTMVVTSPGTYTIQLIATNNVTSNVITQTVQVLSCAPIAAFSQKTLHYCDTTERSIYPTNLTNSVAAAGANTWTWSISPNLSSNVLVGGQIGGTHNPGFEVKIKNTTQTSYTVTLKASNASGTGSVSQVVKVVFGNAWCDSVSKANGINELDGDAGINVYPNPAHDQATIAFNDGKEVHHVQLVNMLGSVIYDEKAVKGESVTIMLAGKPKGVYLVRVDSGSQKVTRRIVIE